MKIQLALLALLAGCQTETQPQAEAAIEHLSESPVTRAEVDSLEPYQHLEIHLAPGHELRVDEVRDLSHVVIWFAGQRQDLIGWLERITHDIKVSPIRSGASASLICEGESCCLNLSAGEKLCQRL